MKFRKAYSGPLGTPRKFSKPGLTVPDQSMTISQILRRHAQGLPAMGGRQMIFEAVENAGFDDERIPDLRNLDFAEKQEVLERIDQELRDIKVRVNKERKAKRDAQYKADLEKEVQLALGKQRAEAAAAAKEGPKQ